MSVATERPQLPFARPNVLDLAPLYEVLRRETPITPVTTPAGDRRLAGHPVRRGTRAARRQAARSLPSRAGTGGAHHDRRGAGRALWQLRHRGGRPRPDAPAADPGVLGQADADARPTTCKSWSTAMSTSCSSSMPPPRRGRRPARRAGLPAAGRGHLPAARRAGGATASASTRCRNAWPTYAIGDDAHQAREEFSRYMVGLVETKRAAAGRGRDLRPRARPGRRRGLRLRRDDPALRRAAVRRARDHGQPHRAWHAVPAHPPRALGRADRRPRRPGRRHRRGDHAPGRAR